MFRRPPGSSLIVVLLLSALAVAGALTYQAQIATRSQRATAENVLRDYATFASWELSRLAQRELNEVLGAQLAKLSAGCSGLRSLPDLHRLVHAKDG